MEDCVFCKIVKGEIPSAKIYEDEKCLAFLSLKQNNDGHTLVIPKEHYKNILETPDDVMRDLAVQIKHLSIAVKEGMNAEGINVISNLEKAAGQAVFHTHIHIIPRYENDGYHHWPQKEGYSEEKSKEVAEKIIKFL